MMTWILMVFTISLQGGMQANSQSQMSIEFGTKGACIKAAEEWTRRTKKEYRQTVVLCTPKH